MSQFSPESALLGGVLIGLSASLLWAFDGKIAGVSGMLAGLVAPEGVASERGPRGFFLLGLLLGGFVLSAVQPSLIVAAERPLILLLGAGLCVGIGTNLSGGCTSGHGVCGVSRGARRSLVATVTFMATGMVSALLVRTLLAAAP